MKFWQSKIIVPQVIDKFASTLLVLIYGILFARLAPSNVFGTYQVWVAWLSLLGVILEFGWPEYLFHKVSQHCVKSVASLLLKIQLAVSVLAWISLLIISIVTRQNLIAALSCILPLLSYSNSLVENASIRLNIAHFVARKTIISSIVEFLLKTTTLVVMKSSVGPQLALKGLSNNLKLIYFLKFFKADLLNKFLSKRKLIYAFKTLFKAYPFVLTNFAVIMYSKADIIMLNYWKGPTSVSTYSITIYVIESMMILPILLAKNLYLKQEPQSNTLKYKVRSPVIIGLILTLLCSTVMPSLIILFFGSKFTDSAKLLPYASLLLLPSTLGVFTGISINAQCHPVVNLTRAVIGMITNVYFNFILIPGNGTTGAIASSVISMYVMVASGIFISPKTRTITMHQLIQI